MASSLDEKLNAALDERNQAHAYYVYCAKRVLELKDEARGYVRKATAPVDRPAGIGNPAERGFGSGEVAGSLQLPACLGNPPIGWSLSH